MSNNITCAMSKYSYDFTLQIISLSTFLFGQDKISVSLLNYSANSSHSSFLFFFFSLGTQFLVLLFLYFHRDPSLYIEFCIGEKTSLMMFSIFIFLLLSLFLFVCIYSYGFFFKLKSLPNSMLLIEFSSLFFFFILKS